MKKAFIGSRLRQLRRERGLTQAAMADSLGISAAYVNMLEKNQRSLSVPVLMALSAQFGIDWQDVVPDSGSTLLADLRTAIQDPIFNEQTPDLDELRLAIDHAPVLAAAFLKLYQSHRAAIDNIMRLGNEKMPADMVALSSETTIHDFFRSCGNHFDPLERAAEQLATDRPCPPDEMYMMLKARLHKKHGISVTTLPIEEMKDAMEGLLSAKIEENVVGSAEIRETFKISKVGTIAGCFVIDGNIKRNNKVRVIREGVVVYTGTLGSLKRFKDDVKEVAKGFECGLNIDRFNDIKVGDVVEAYEEVEVKQTLED